MSADPTAPADVLWEGGPAPGPTREDLLAGLTAFGATAVVLCGGLALLHSVEPLRALRLGLAYAAVVAGTTVGARVAGASTTITLLSAFFLPIGAAAVATEQRGLALVCPLVSAALLGLLLVMRLRQRRATRYWVTARGAAFGEQGRYLISFSIIRPPQVVPDRFGGGLGDLDFGHVEAKLTTRDGKTFKLPARPRRFHRVAGPERVLAHLSGRA